MLIHTQKYVALILINGLGGHKRGKNNVILMVRVMEYKTFFFFHLLKKHLFG